jgi:hypothetical protein
MYPWDLFNGILGSKPRYLRLVTGGSLCTRRNTPDDVRDL